MKWLLSVLMLALTAGQAVAADPPAPPKLEAQDLDVLRALIAERRALEERFGRLQAEVRMIQAELPALQRDHEAKGKELEQAIAEAAKRSKIEIKDGWVPDVAGKTWRKATP